MKNTQEYKAIGLMSGTSMDGLDIAYCYFNFNNHQWSSSLIKAETITYPEFLHNKIEKATQLTGLELTELDIELGKWYGHQTKYFIAKHDIQVDFISSHGHTIFHQPEKGLTLQIGRGVEIANACQLPVINDFRSLDVSLGGQGAPLVPVGDQLLFHDYDICINLGGIANLSFEENGIRKAFDISPCNMILNPMAQVLGKPYDQDGKLASEGVILTDYLKELNALAYYHAKYPKTLGYEWVHQHILSKIETSKTSAADLLATFVEHISYQIIRSIELSSAENKKVLLTGGGALNKFLVKNIKAKVNETTLIEEPPENIILFKEAMIFAFLGVLRYRNESNCLASVTGAKKDSCGGTIHHLISS